MTAKLREWIDKSTFMLISAIASAIVVYVTNSYPQRPEVIALLAAIVSALVAWIGVQSGSIDNAKTG